MANHKAYKIPISMYVRPCIVSWGNFSGTVKVNGSGVSRDIVVFKKEEALDLKDASNSIAYGIYQSESDGSFVARVKAGPNDRFTLLAKGDITEGEKDAVFNNVAPILE